MQQRLQEFNTYTAKGYQINFRSSFSKKYLNTIARHKLINKDRKLKAYFIAFTFAGALLLQGCGGGGGGTAATSVNEKLTPLLSSSPIFLPSLESNISQLCGTETNIHRHIEDIDGDGKKDIILNLHCSSSALGEINSRPMKSHVVILKNKGGGVFEDVTQTMLGSKYFDIDSRANEIISYDFNKDGRTDFVMALNREDGRNADYPATNINAQNAFFMSNSNGTLDYMRMGQFAWNYSLTLADNAYGAADLISLPIGFGAGTEGWRYAKNGWEKIEDFSWAKGKPLFLKRKSPSVGSDTAIFSFASTSLVGLELRTRNSQGVWSTAHSYELPYTGEIELISWNGARGKTPVTRYQGKNYIFFNFGDGMCELASGPNPIFVSSVWGKEVPDDYQGKTYTEGELKFFNKIMAFNIDGGKIIPNSQFNVRNEVTDTFSMEVRCDDVNDDGQNDIQIIQWIAGTYPLVYLNLGSLEFSSVKPSNFPPPKQFARGLTQYYIDIDGDGIRDLLVFPNVGLQGNEKPLIHLYKGNRNALEIDTK